MKCYDARRKLSALIDGAGEPALREAVARHVDGCAACRAELEALAATDRALRQAVRAEPPDGYFDELTPRILARLHGPQVAELADLRALADRALERAAERRSDEVDLVEAPAALGQVVLPVAAPGTPRR